MADANVPLNTADTIGTTSGVQKCAVDWTQLSNGNITESISGGAPPQLLPNAAITQAPGVPTLLVRAPRRL
ncbi:MAG TPA: hypothetical protein VFC47_04870 [Caulobacteraceae bacterium]|nr:hypothetical protein [Caulobacteraceae bacterium]